MALKPNFSAQLSDTEQLKKIAANLGYVQPGGPDKGKGSIRQLLEAIIAGDASVALKPEAERERKLGEKEARLQQLEAMGLIKRPRKKGKPAPFKPIKVEGEPVSEMIIRERR